MTKIIILAYEKKISNSDIIYIKNLKDTKIASDLKNFHTVSLPFVPYVNYERTLINSI